MLSESFNFFMQFVFAVFLVINELKMFVADNILKMHNNFQMDITNTFIFFQNKEDIYNYPQHF